MAKRFLSIDVFRGFVIFMMVFVNDVASVSGIPYWMKHAGTHDGYMTFVDVVFPAFLFIVGMAIPLAVRSRIKKGQSWAGIWRHVIYRTMGLLALGFFMVNAGEMNKGANVLPPGLWNILLYLSAFLIWNAYPRVADGRRRNLFKGLQALGVAILFLLAATFRKGEEPNLIGMTASWWGILGLIGWAYLYSMAIYFCLRSNLVAMAGMLGMFAVAVAGLQFSETELPVALAWLKGQSGNFSHTMITLAGTLFCALLMEVYRQRPLQIKMQFMAGFGLLAFLAGLFLQPIAGISKNLATPSWGLFSVAICCALFIVFFWLVEIKGRRKWFEFLQPAGENALLTYLLPFVVYALGWFEFMPEVLNHGVVGVVRSLIFTLLILALARYLTEKGIRLKL